MESIILHMPEEKSFQSLCTRLESRNTKDALQSLADIFLKLMAGKQIDFVDDNNEMLPTPLYVKQLMLSRYQIKGVYVRFCAMMLCDPHNLRTYLSFLPESYVRAYRELLLRHFVPMDELRDKFGIKVKVPSEFRYSWNKRTLLDMPFIEYFYSGYDEHFNYTYSVGMLQSMREFFYEALLPGMSKLVVSDTLPKGITECCNELSSLQIMPVVEALLERDILEYGTSRFSAASVKKAAKQLGASEFFTKTSHPKELALMRNSFLLQTAGIAKKFTRKASMPENIEDKIMFIIMKMLNEKEQTYPMILGHITGLRSSVYRICNGKTIIERILSNIKKLPSGKWVSVDSFINHVFLSNAYYGSLHFVQNSNSNGNFCNKFPREEHTIDFFHQITEMGIPYVRGLLFMLASWGVLDIGCRDFNNTDISPYDSLQYIRLTNLGEYVFDLVETYEKPAMENECAFFELDPERLIIRSLSDNNPYENLLTDTCISIGNHRYKMNEETFLANCHNRTDVVEKIDFFKRYISGDLSATWEAFFTSLLNRCKPLTPIDIRNYHLYSISPDNSDLIHLLTSDSILRKLYIRAENYIILVKSENQTKFENRLKSLGYLV